MRCPTVIGHSLVALTLAACEQASQARAERAAAPGVVAQRPPVRITTAVAQSPMRAAPPGARRLASALVGGGAMMAALLGSAETLVTARAGALAQVTPPPPAPPPPDRPAPAPPRPSLPGVAAPAHVVQELRQTLTQALQRFEARDVNGVLAHVSDRYWTGPLTKATIRGQIVALFQVYEAVRAQVRIDEVRMVGEHAWVYSTGEVSGRLPVVGHWMTLYSWERDLEVARREGGAWRLYGYQQ